jgi:hypothetical protein
MGADKGLIRPHEPLVGTADVIQSLLVGRILVDILNDEERDETWVRAAVEVFRALLRPQ